MTAALLLSGAAYAEKLTPAQFESQFKAMAASGELGAALTAAYSAGPDKKEILTGYTALFASDAVAKRLVGEFDAAGLLDTANYPKNAERRDVMALFAQSFTEDLFVKGLRRLTPAEKKTYFKFLAFRLTQMSPVLCKRVAAGDPKASEDQEYVRVMRGLYAAMDKDLLQDFLSARSRAVLAEIRAFPAVAKVSGEKEREGRDAMNAALEARLAALPEGERTALKAGLTDPMKASAENTCRAFGFYLSTIASLTGEAGDNYVSTAVNRLAGHE
ncbi:hypothetical protein [Duodenibacillus massiliensis]|uniref:hypothetical protein n=1 Tax=Duodenibacillus massiliensis TaxID=1852381 RepID=UPI001160F5A3|nr:hypothetical protein [Duodenibacillus massiliensis]